ncbi:MAG: hypothetical protein ABSE53_11010 [Terracidiphilus sp.]
MAHEIHGGYNTEDARATSDCRVEFTVNLSWNSPQSASTTCWQADPFGECIAALFRIAHREAFPHSTFDTSSIDSGDSGAIGEAFRDYTETALRAELDQYEQSGRNVQAFSEAGIEFGIHPWLQDRAMDEIEPMNFGSGDEEDARCGAGRRSG